MFGPSLHFSLDIWVGSILCSGFGPESQLLLPTKSWPNLDQSWVNFFFFFFFLRERSLIRLTYLGNFDMSGRFVKYKINFRII